MAEIAREILPVNLEDEMRKSYLDYAMSVIVGRALPDVRDGLKPVHRRVLYAMRELGNDWNRAYKKSARVVGDVIGKYHPHGDASVYDAIVRMAQPFSMRYLLVDGQGNFGSVDGDPPAAMRYTEVRMSRLAAELLADIDKETVDFMPNYDESETEPAVLPTRIPNLLINGSSGIAVGMATNIPPHNLSEIISACIALIENPNLSLAQLMQIVPGPDFPTAGLINGAQEIVAAYKTGRGRLHVRARTHIEDVGRGDRQAIIITELPYQVNKAKLIERIADLVRDKLIEGIASDGLRDESDKDGMRVVIELKRGEVPEVLLNNLFAQTTDGDGVRHQHGRAGRRTAAPAELEGNARGIPAPSARDRHPAHGLRTAQGARARPYPGGSGDRAREHRRDHRGDQGVAFARRSQDRPGVADLELGRGAGDAGPRGRHQHPPRGRDRGLGPGRRRIPADRNPGTGDSGHAPESPDRPRAGQDHRRIPGAAGADSRFERHSRASRAIARA